ncbi:hypothetical protein ACFC1I_15140 [Microbacterium sp. NPDC056044]|uniref:hypothetical protein n=1 Tax=Microbacterium sp. NPDC056044 TaxID=3345690 RepID=UPI0035D9BDEA
MSRREVIRRIAIWSVPVLFVAVAIGLLVVRHDSFLLVGWTGFPLVGAVILTARPRNNIGRLLMVAGGVWLVAAITLILVETLRDELPWVVTSLLGTIGATAGIIAFLPLVLIILTFPSGEVRTTLGRIVLWFAIAQAIACAMLTILVPVPDALEPFFGTRPWAVAALEPFSMLAIGLMNLAIPVPIAAALVDLVVRWRRSKDVERLQYRWFAFGAGVVVVALAIDQLSQLLAPAVWAAVLAAVPLGLALNAIPITIGVAVTRHGLYEINRIVSRTVAYTLVTVAAVVIYAFVVTSVTWLLPGAPSLAVAGATLSAAALFLPVLRRVQRVVDRRFDRERYDSARVVDAFGEEVRSRVDPSGTGTHLVQAVDETLQPASAGLWLAEGGSR